jgi:hypothetical protein
MNRILKRPMFRMGGSSGTGITSGLDKPRQQYAIGDLVKVLPTQEELATAREMYPQFQTPPSQAINRLLISGGLDLLSRPPQGGTLATAAAAFKEPTKQLFEDIDTEKATKFATDADLFKTLIEAKGEALGGIEGKTYSQLEIGKQIQRDIFKIADLQKQLQNKDLTQEQREDLNLQLKAVNSNLDFLRKNNPIVDRFLKDENLSSGFLNAVVLELAADKEKYPKGMSDPNIYIDAAKIMDQRLKALGTGTTIERTSEAEGGRIGYQMGGGADIISTKEEPKIDYSTLRARLPKEISDDVVRLISASPEALEDFATIATQSDVDMFNQKYSVNLTLPQEA